MSQVNPVEMKDISIEDSDEPVVQYMDELLDICAQGVCFEIHRAAKLGYWELEQIDDESQQDFKIVDEVGLDVFGQMPIKKQQDCVCPNCSRSLAANRFAPHLEKCMGMGRSSSRVASRRLQTTGRMEEFDGDNDIDIDWSFEYERKSRKAKSRENKLTYSPKRSKVRRGESSIGLSSLVNHSSNGGSRPGTPSSLGSGDIGTCIKTGPTLQALEALSQEEKVALLTQTCGAISGHTGKMCTRTGRCVQHTDEQRRSVRDLLLGETTEVPWPPSMRPEGSSLDQDDVHVDVDGFEDMEDLRELTPLPWEQESNLSTGSDSLSGPLVPPSPIILKKKKGRKVRPR